MKKIALHGSKNVIHAQLRRYRELRKLTQDQVAAKLQVMGVNIDQQALSRSEHNERMVTDYEFACLCQVLQVSERDLLGDCYNRAEP